MLRGLQGPSKSFSYLGAGNKLFGLQHKRVVARPYGSESLKTKDHRKRNIARAADEQVQLLQATIDGYESSNKARKLLVYLPGTDGTGNAISPQLKGLLSAGFDVRALYICISNRSDWTELTKQTISLIRSLVREHPTESQVTLTAESFGGCLALRCLAAAPELFERAVLVNPATCFEESYGGVLGLLAKTNLLSIFPEQLYQVAQAVLVPFLVEQQNMGNIGLDAVREMIEMNPPQNRRVAELSTEQSSSSRSRVSPLMQLESYGPAAAGSWRLALLSTGNVPDRTLAKIRTPTLLISSAKDRLLGSLKEGARLERAMANAMRVVLPKSGHTALLEDDVDLVNILRWSNFLPHDLSPSGVDKHSSYSARDNRAATSSSHSYAGVSHLVHSSSNNGYHHANGLQNGSALPRSPQSRIAIDNLKSSTAIASPQGRSPSPKTSDTNGSIPENSMTASVSPVQRLQNGASTTPHDGDNGKGYLNGSHQNGQQSISQPKLSTEQSSLEAVQLRKKTPWSLPEPKFDQAISVMSPFREVISPVVHGIENLPSASSTSRPLLFVGNHARIGLYDMPYLIIELYLRGIKVRGLAHPGHWKGPLGGVFEFFGAVKASPRSAYKLLKDGEAVLLFPGGGREVNKRRGEEYQLFWSEEPDFVRMAAKLNALIIPFASVGADEAFDIALDSSEVLKTPILGNLMRGFMRNVDPNLNLDESVPPLTSIPGLGIPSLLPIPNLSRLYFRFMPPIDPARDGKDLPKDGPLAQEIYAEVKQEVYKGISMLRNEQQADPKNSLSTRLFEQFSRVFPAFDLLKQR